MGRAKKSFRLKKKEGAGLDPQQKRVCQEVQTDLDQLFVVSARSTRGNHTIFKCILFTRKVHFLTKCFQNMYTYGAVRGCQTRFGWSQTSFEQF